jgi:hypothetical protein
MRCWLWPFLNRDLGVVRKLRRLAGEGETRVHTP